MYVVIFIVLGLLIQLKADKIDPPYFYVAHGKSKCFIENLPEKLPVNITYKSFNSTEITCNLEIYDSKKSIVFQKAIDYHDDLKKESYLTKESGQHEICINCQNAKRISNNALKWHLNVDLGDSEIIFENAANSINLVSTDRVLRKLIMTVDNLTKEQLYNNETFRLMSNFASKLKARVTRFTILQMFFFTISTVISLYALKSNFQKRNLVA